MFWPGSGMRAQGQALIGYAGPSRLACRSFSEGQAREAKEFGTESTINALRVPGQTMICEGSSIFREGNKDKICELFVNDEETAKFIGIFIGGAKIVLVFNEIALNKFIHKRGIVIPFSMGGFYINQHLAYGLIDFADGKDRIFKSPFSYLVGGFLQEVFAMFMKR
jgi:hypothetical protein